MRVFPAGILQIPQEILTKTDLKSIKQLTVCGVLKTLILSKEFLINNAYPQEVVKKKMPSPGKH